VRCERGGDAGESGNSGVFEELAGGQGEAGFAGAGDDLDGEDGVAADFEKVVGSADAVEAEDLDPDGGQGLLGGGGGWDEGAGGGGAFGGGGGEGFAVELSVRRDGEFFGKGKRGRRLWRGEGGSGEGGGGRRGGGAGRRGMVERRTLNAER